MARRVLPRRGSSDDGFALVEALVSLMLVGLMASAIASTVATSDRGNQTSRSTDAAVSFARARLEETRRIGYDTIAHATGSHASDPAVVAGAFDPDGSGPLVSEPVLYSSTGSVQNQVTWSHLGTTYTAKTYVTDAGSNLKRITTIVTWTQGNQPRTTSVSSLLARTAVPTAAAADVIHDSATGAHQISVRIRRGGGSETASADLPSPIPGWAITGGTSTGTAAPGISHLATSAISNATINVPGLTVSMSGVYTSVSATTSGITTQIQGTVTINGVPYVNPLPGTELIVGVYAITLGYKLVGTDGSTAASFMRIKTVTTDRHLAWAWVRPIKAF
ncbi:MAG: hypothetical protein ACLGH3_02955 [Actinomycetota bacterium]